MPSWVKGDQVWFITIKCLRRRANQLAYEPVASQILDSAKFYHGLGRWFVHLLLLMPDHLHGLISFPQHEKIRSVIEDWKRYQSRNFGILWQIDFFDHRLRRSESFDEKAAYIRMNPVRAGLVENCDDWPFAFAFDRRGNDAQSSVAVTQL